MHKNQDQDASVCLKFCIPGISVYVPWTGFHLGGGGAKGATAPPFGYFVPHLGSHRG